MIIGIKALIAAGASLTIGILIQRLKERYYKRRIAIYDDHWSNPRPTLTKRTQKAMKTYNNSVVANRLKWNFDIETDADFCKLCAYFVRYCEGTADLKKMVIVFPDHSRIYREDGNFYAKDN